MLKICIQYNITLLITLNLNLALSKNLGPKLKGQVQLMVKGSLNQTLPQFEEHIFKFSVRLGSVKVPQIEEAFNSRNLLPSTALDLNLDLVKKNLVDLVACSIQKQKFDYQPIIIR